MGSFLHIISVFERLKERYLIGVFEKGYEIKDPGAWDSGVIKQSPDFKGEILKEGFFDLSGF